MANRTDSISLAAADISGLKNAATRDVGTTPGTVTAGDDARLTTVDGKSGGVIKGNAACDIEYDNELNRTGGILNSRIKVGGIARGMFAHYCVTSGATRRGVLHVQQDPDSSGAGAVFYFDTTGNAVAPAAWVPNSDERLKDGIERIKEPLEKMKELKGCTWKRQDTGAWGIGFIAQDVEKVFPEAVQRSGDRLMPDGSIVEGVLSPDTYGVAAALHHEAILKLMEQIEFLKDEVANLKI